ncbi:MAG TPA: bifunctional glutamate N-acetyltransferase/amino-acid acetyltransferase ArgJ [Anaerolineae bacterium]|nr:bifunctional glutamate N-acetyltransferase/amino-acid acetyltransferase ArgJ [Anaerolineae bacterium]HOR00126.1 bifunctional glutamate N-acetyltransferase/amino-acid acetyltransferase ArgJ [Anaerolineae bacterium]HPL28179.1 bifunctional glutamate N-acetyltransferase/amino-acid acetyltransferase ArgJ [Anaerolineae bacterium]
MALEWLAGGTVTSVPGFLASGVACGIKRPAAPDLALVAAERPCAAAGVFTTNRFPAAPVLYDRAALAASPYVQAVAINAGCANACTGDEGLADAREMAGLVASGLGCPPEAVLVMSTGVIGVRLPMERLRVGIPQAAQALSADGGAAAARAIMTTDTRPKACAVRTVVGGRVVTVGGMAKGSGMIHPNMATMLAVIATDAAATPPVLDALLRRAVGRSFNAVTVDGDTSTNDTLLLLANGAAGRAELSDPDAPEAQALAEALEVVAVHLAQAIARDGEGASHFVTVRVRGAAGEADARRAAKAVANSPLVKTAIYGGDPNWGRVLCAVGYSGCAVDPARAALWFGELALVAGGRPLDYDEKQAAAVLQQPEVTITVDLGLGAGEATVWTCDLTHRYVDINAHYRT